MGNNSYNIDLVYLWVDGSDPAWMAKRNAFMGKPTESSQANCKGRTSNNDELKYSLRSVEAYAPWIRKVFIVTDNQRPAWLNTTNLKANIVDIAEIMPEECLPCYNSALIEHFLYKIPGLSEHFLYANDDMFINKPTVPSFFFAEDGLPIVRLIHSRSRDFFLSFKEKYIGIPLKNYMLTIRNSAKLVEKKLGVYYAGKPHHNMDAYLKSDFQKVEQMFKDEIKKTHSNHFRSDNDLQRCLHSYAALAENRGHLLYVTQKTSFRFHIQKEGHYRKLAKYNPVLFCMNDSEYATDDDRKRVTAFLAKRFPEKSQFEK